MENNTDIHKQIIQPFIRLSKLALGNYSWEIKMSNEDTDKLLDDIGRVNSALLKKYPTKEIIKKTKRGKVKR